jgi:hypothetical protein
VNYGRGTVHHTRTFWILVLLITIGCTAVAVYPAGTAARSPFVSALNPTSPPSTPNPTSTTSVEASETPATPVEASETPTVEAVPTGPVQVFTAFPTLEPPTLFPSPVPSFTPAPTPTVPPTATATPTPISPFEKTATAVAKGFLPAPTLTLPGLLPPVPLGAAPVTPLSGPTLTPLPPHDDPSPRPTPPTPGIFQFTNTNLVLIGVAGICWSVLAIGVLAVAAVWVLRKRS